MGQPLCLAKPWLCMPQAETAASKALTSRGLRRTCIYMMLDFQMNGKI